MSSEQLANLPDILAMLVLLAILLVMQRRRLRAMNGTWLLAVVMTVLTQACWYFSRSFPVPHEIFHIFTLNAELLAGMAFLLYRQEGIPLRRDFMMLLGWALPALLCLETLYGWEVRLPLPYVICAVAGALIGVAASLRYQRSAVLALLQACGWAAVARCALLHDTRGAAYTAIGCVYAAAAYNSYRSIRKSNLGRIILSTTLAIWAISSFLHSWVTLHPYYRAFAEEFFALERYFVTIGMLIVLLEDEIRENERLALHDQLTGLPNRRHLEQRVLCCLDGQDASVLVVDLDGFKAVNDSLGHSAGDDLLCQTASRLASLVTEADTVSRVGGDEFIIVTHTAAPKLADAVRAAIQEPFHIDGSRVHISASVGASVFPQDATDLTGATAVARLIQVADRRMYAVKHAFPSSAERRARFSLEPASEPAKAFAPQ